MKSALRGIDKIFTAPIVPELSGARVRRIIGTPYLRRLDPFLTFDHYCVRLPSGFTDHPHRGFETVTYNLKGKIFHEDFKGRKGIIGPGDCQWMTAGKGIVHAEMPGSWDEDSEGLQLWINLPIKEKLCEPQYQEVPKDTIPRTTKDNTTVKVIAGESLGVKGPIFHRTPTYFIDVEMEKEGKLEQCIPKNWNGLCYVYEGVAYFGANQEKAQENQAVVLKNEDNDTLLIKTKGEKAKFVIVAGQLLNEPIIRYGPFVLGSEEQLLKSFEDYEKGINGFEGSKQFVSKIREMAFKGSK